MKMGETNAPREQGRSPRTAFPFMLLMIIGLLAAFFLFNGFEFYFRGETGQSIAYFVLGILGVSFAAFMANRLVGKISIPTPSVPLTTIVCTKCDFKNVRDFQVGDYIPKSAGTCPSCGGSSIIDRIYIEDKTPQKKKKEDYV
ncbi:MAG: hypothetical protein ABIH76_06420 [Candidatus Bathyarchaeota archaeon]